MAESDQDAGEVQTTAYVQVFNTPELAEIIFLELSTCDVLANIQRTCRSWQNIVVGSTRLQQALFFKPIDTRRLYFFDAAGAEPRRWAEDEHATTRDPAPMHDPCLPRLLGQMQCLLGSPRCPYKTKSYNRPEASWRQQLITQPPIARLDVRSRCETRVIEAASGGITMGDLMHTLRYINQDYKITVDTALFMSGCSLWQTPSVREDLRGLRAKMLG